MKNSKLNIKFQNMGYQRPKIIQGMNILMHEKVTYDEKITFSGYQSLWNFTEII